PTRATPCFPTRRSSDLATVAGEPVKVAVAGSRGNTLLAFLSSGCLPCHKLWRGLSDDHPRLPAGARLVIVTKDRGEESPTRLGEDRKSTRLNSSHGSIS